MSSSELFWVVKEKGIVIPLIVPLSTDTQI